MLFDWPVNYSTISPSGSLCAVVGDNAVGLLVDMTSGKQVAQLAGHYDYSFAATWHPNGNLLATGNQVLLLILPCILPC
jgi:WD40 repeat protein